MKHVSVLDPLHGAIEFDEDISALIAAPIVQRMRHVRLSNIDSLDMPGISGLSRYEHVLGVAHLASRTGLHARLDRHDRLALAAASLLHDWAITAFGHLVEEAFQFVGTRFDHEGRLYDIVTGEAPEELGGANRQVLEGRETGLGAWAERVVGKRNSAHFIRTITDFIRGQGRLGRLVCGSIDLDNIDNVYRVAFHMGLEVDRKLPLRLAESIVDVLGENGEPVFRREAESDISLWLETRRSVYERLMPADADFAGKLMILSAAISAFIAGEIRKEDWHLTDYAFVNRLLSSKVRSVRETMSRWLAGELWKMSPLYWMSGRRPDYPELLSFSRDLSTALDRECMSYGIKDKRDRQLTIHFEDGSTSVFGSDSQQWLLGVGTSESKTFTARENERILGLAQSYFGSTALGAVHKNTKPRTPGDDQLCLL